MSKPETPITRLEQYLENITGGENEVPDEPLTRIEMYLDEIVKEGAGADANRAEAAATRAEAAAATAVLHGYALDIVDHGVVITEGGDS